MNSTKLEQEYARTICALTRTGITTHLPRSENVGVISIDGKEYPVPTLGQLGEVFTRNKELVDRKMRQGFTQLQLTPIAMPTGQLMERVETALREHSAAGKITETEQDGADEDCVVRVNTAKPVWVWERVRQTLDTPNLVYFPQAYTAHDHEGLTKEEVMQDTRFCAVPGWSVGLIEPIAIMPQPGEGKIIGGRKQLERYTAPRDYLQTLSHATYEGETGWTPEDFLTHFLTQLERTNQVSHARKDSNALWLLGAFMPNAMPKALLVPVGYWAHNGGRLHLTAHRTGNRLKDWVARSTVRLGT